LASCRFRRRAPSPWRTKLLARRPAAPRRAKSQARGALTSVRRADRSRMNTYFFHRRAFQARSKYARQLSMSSPPLAQGAPVLLPLHARPPALSHAGGHGLVGLGPLDDLVKCIDGVAQLVGIRGRLRIGLDSDHQILVGNLDIDRPIAETFALIEPLRAERP
jgi:hypothetical protein